MAYQSEIEKLRRRYEEKPSQWFAALAEEYRRAGDLDQALDIVRRGLEERSNYVSGHIVLARCLLDQKNDAEAERVFEQVLELDSENIIALKMLGEISERGGNEAAARHWVERLLEVDPMNDEAQAALERLSAAPPAEAPPEVPAEEPANPPEPPPEPAPELEVVEAIDGVGSLDAATAPDGSVDADPGPLVIEHAEGADLGTPEPTPLEIEPTDLSQAPAAAVTEAPTLEIPSIPAEEPPSLPGDPPVAVEPAPFPDVSADDEETVVDTPALDIVHEGGPGGDLADWAAGVAGADDDEPAGSLDTDAAENTGGLFGEDEPVMTEAEPESFDPDATVKDIAPLDDETAAPPPTEAPPEPMLPDAAATPVPEVVPAAPDEVEDVITGDAEPAPVVTETMAEVYVKQGLLAEAAGVYEDLLKTRPDDAQLQDRLQAVKGQMAGGVAEPEAPADAGVPDGVGVSSRDFLASVLAARPTSTHSTVPPDAAQAAPPDEPSPLEEAFGDDDSSLAPPGAPMQPAPDNVSLASVFGDESGVPAPQPEAEPPKPGGDGAEGDKQAGVSFDEFFGGEPTPEQKPDDESGESDSGGGEDADFRDWLQGLKS